MRLHSSVDVSLRDCRLRFRDCKLKSILARMEKEDRGGVWLSGSQADRIPRAVTVRAQELSKYLQEQADACGAEPGEIHDLVSLYSQKTDSGFWPLIFLSSTPRHMEKLENCVKTMGVPVVARFSMFELVQVAVPPEPRFLNLLGVQPNIHRVDDAEQIFRLPPPMPLRLFEPQLNQSRELIGAPAEEFPVHGDEILVGVIDSGVDEAHPDLSGRVVMSCDFTSDNDNQDSSGHGTHVAGTIAGNGKASDGQYKGIAPRARILSAKVFPRNGGGRIDTILKGLQWAVESGARIVNLSLGGPARTNGKSIVTVACEKVAEMGVVVCISAGNSGPGSSTITAPGDAPSSLTVGAVDKQRRLASFSSRGPTDSPGVTGIKPNIIAPGVSIVAARSRHSSLPGVGGDLHYAALSGTSMASPHAAGMAALGLAYLEYQKKSGMTPRILKKMIEDSARPVRGYDEHQQGRGLIYWPALKALLDEYKSSDSDEPPDSHAGEGGEDLRRRLANALETAREIAESARLVEGQERADRLEGAARIRAKVTQALRQLDEWHDARALK